MAATRPMAQQNKKHGNLAQECFTEGMVDHEMHLKMSKKIAQLTKVIYALNTKNDEHEMIVKSLQQQHDKEKTQLLEQTKRKIEELRSKLGLESEFQERISLLEHSIEQHEKQKKRLLHDFDAFKGECADHEAEIKAEQDLKVTSLTQMLQQTQQEFEVKMKSFETIMGAFEQDRDETLAEMQRTHKIEIDNLLKTQQSQSSDVHGQLEALKQRYSAELEQAKSLYNELKTNKDEMETDYEEKLKKSKALYEKELELLRQNQSDTMNDKQKMLQDKIDKLTKDMQFQEAQARHRIDGLVNDISVSEETIIKLKADLECLDLKHTNAAEQRDALMAQLEGARGDAMNAVEQYREAERELQVIRERCNEQADQLVQKSGVIGELTAAKSQKEVQVQKLTDELSDVSRKLKVLQDEKNKLLSQSSNDAQQKSLEVQALEKALEEVRIEKQAQKDKYVVDVAGLERLIDEERSKGELRLRDEIEKLTKQHQLDIKQLQEEEEHKRLSQEQSMRSNFEDEISKLERTNKELQASLGAEISDLRSKLKIAEDELERLQKTVGDTSSNLGAATSELTSLKNEVSQLTQQLDKANHELKSVSSQHNSIKEERDRLKLLSSQMVKDHEAELRQKLEDLNKSLEATWLEKLRKEIAQLKTELEKQHANDRASTIKHLTDEKNLQIRHMTEQSEHKIRQLTIQIDELERSLRDERSSGDSKLSTIRDKYEQQIQVLTSEIDKLTQEYERQLENLSSVIELKWTEKLENQESTHQTKVMEVKQKHIEDMTAQMTAHKSAVDMIRREAENERISELELEQQRGQQQQETLREELETKHKSQLETQTQNNMKQITALRMELQRAVELRKQKEHDLEQASEEFGEKITLRDRNIKSLESDLRKLEEGIQKLNLEIEEKGKEILKVRSDANRKLRKREESLALEHAEELERMRGHHADETQQMLSEFSRAQAILKDKIEDLTALLEEAEERYMNREPRDEDLTLIEHLRRSLTQREEEMQQLLADKQFYQMELVNRETNFTKVFAGGKQGPQQPQVGFINPLAKKKKGEKGPTKYAVSMGAMEGGISGNSSASSTTQRLRPIAGSPIHDERLNPKHVLPQPHAFTKKFVQ